MSYQKIKIDAFCIGGMLMKKFLAIAAHVISGLGNDLLGWVIIISFGLTGSEGKFQDDVFHWIIFACGLIHIAVSVLYSLLVWKRVRRMVMLCREKFLQFMISL